MAWSLSAGAAPRPVVLSSASMVRGSAIMVWSAICTRQRLRQPVRPSTQPRWPAYSWRRPSGQVACSATRTYS